MSCIWTPFSRKSSRLVTELDSGLTTSFCHRDKSPQPSTSPIEEMLMVYAAAISVVLLVSHLVGSKIVAHVRKTAAEPAIVTEVSQNPFKKHVSQLGGGWIFTFMGLRLVLSSALTLLSFVSAFKSGDSTRRIVIALSITSVCFELFSNLAENLTCCTYTQAYTVILTALSMLTPVKWSDVLTRHANTLWLISFTVFGYRDLYPSATFDLTPLDIEEGWFIWVKIALLFILAIVIPLAIPRRYIPHNPKVSFLPCISIIHDLQSAYFSRNLPLTQHLSRPLPSSHSCSTSFWIPSSLKHVRSLICHMTIFLLWPIMTMPKTFD